MTQPILKITDGTDEISLINRDGNAFFLNAWRPGIPQFKGGGVWQQSSLSDGRRMVHRQWGNVIEVFDLKLMDVGPDAIMRETQDLRRLLLKAVDYWATGWQNEPVWIETRARNETNIRYALIHSWSTPDDENPFAQPFMQPLGGSVMNNFTLAIERGHWTAEEPGTSTCVELRGEYGYPVDNFVAVTPSTGTDDAYVITTLSTITTGGTELIFGNIVGDTYDIGIRFRNVTIDRNTPIAQAFIRFFASSTLGGTTCDTTIDGEDNSNPATFSTYTDFVSRTKTSISVNWNNIPAWTVNNDYYTPNISKIIQEIIDRPDWINGGDIVIFVHDNSSSANAQRRAASYEHISLNPPALFILYTEDEDCDDEIFFASRHNHNNLTHIFIDDGGVVGTNRLDGIPPYDLLPAAPVQNDAIYFGIDINDDNNSPFASLVFDVGTAAVYAGGETMIWEYHDGVGPWATLNTRDLTAALTNQPFSNTGVNSVAWQHPQNLSGGVPYANDWTTVDLNAVLGYGPAITAWWIRARCNTVGTPTTPTQQNRHVYTVSWPYIEVDEAQVTGDIPALLRMALKNKHDQGTIIYPGRPIKIMTGLRSLSRGSEFTAYLNFADKCNPVGLTVSADTDTSFVSRVSAPTGRAAYYNVTAVDTWSDIFTFTFSSTLAANYYGRYRPVLGFYGGYTPPGQYAYLRFRLKIQQGSANTFITDAVSIPHQNRSWLSFGGIDFPGAPFDRDDPATNAKIILQGYYDDSAGGPVTDIYLMALILMPSDEWIGFYEEDRTGTSSYPASLRINDYLDIDPFLFKYGTRALARESDDDIYYIWKTRQNATPMLQANSDQRLWFFPISVANPIFDSQYDPDNLITTQAWRIAQYLSMRGNR